MSDDDIIVVTDGSTTKVEEVPYTLDLGQWYWVKHQPDDDEPDDDEDASPPKVSWLGCVTHIGSNYVELTSVSGGRNRVHADVFDAWCKPEHNAPEYISAKIVEYKGKVSDLMVEVESLTQRLGVGRTLSLQSGSSEGAALAKLGNTDVGEYKTALIKAKEDDLPALFKAIEVAHSYLAMWLKAETIPLKAQVEQMKGVTDRIDSRIFNIELYAGLTERVIQFAEGEPAPMSEKIRLMQRRHYMDEECLAKYEAGGMEFKDIEAFDAWLARPENRDRILPFPRCIVAFQVRRHTKDRGVPRTFIELFQMYDEVQADKFTFLYIRNGENLYCLSTRVDFTEQLFPDADHHNLTSGAKLWAKNGIEITIITDAQYQGKIEDYERKKAEHARKKAELPAKKREWRARKKAAKQAGERFTEGEPWLSSFWEDDPRKSYHEFEPGNIYYDDIRAQIAKDIQQYNRIGMIIQGLLDRSPILHPHPPWKIWSEDGFRQAIEMIYDDSRAMVAGEKPDFEAYRQRLNKSLKTGSVTVGQAAAWRKDEKEKDEEDRRRRGYRDAPPTLARVEKFAPRARKCTYAWKRDFTRTDNNVRNVYTCDADRVLNVDAYTPGDFKIFFSDPRTRTEYLQWAPLLLEAEEYHAGNREVEDPPPPTPKTSSYEGRERYRRKKARDRLIGRIVTNKHAIHMKRGDTVHPAGMRWKARAGYRGAILIEEVDKKGNVIENGAYVANMEYYDLELVD